MENMESQIPAVIAEEAVETPAEVTADELFENLTREEDPEPEPEPEPEEQPEEEPVAEPEVSEEEAHKQAITNGLQMLFEDGWTHEELLAFSNDKTVRADIAAGKDVVRAAMAYERRQRSNAKPAPKKSVPTLRAPATSGAKDMSAIDEMTDAQFDEFSKRAKEALMAGKLVSFQ